ncbi:hypothetical protein FA95DRAFT_1585401 [Auriscalpium vulgare]|uniref:Uncharacterized protein n=1 Tax=Auriscalpium vulgare TaxID=40419 RepID=A0ACB8R463_9AGAM|nr:hypothetical protein FA95DRAFT_1585401 [Auriscalpium vulgare]
MRANTVMYQIPMPKVYHVLPPKKEELDEVIAFIYIGPVKPTEKEYRRTPMLVRRNKVAKALEWLKLNHYDYADLAISYENLEDYPEDMPPVIVDYRQPPLESDSENLAVQQDEDNDGTTEGQCPFVVHTLTGEQLDKKSGKERKVLAMKYLKQGQKVLGIGHAEAAESIWGNPQLYPSAFPWLFPYGLGGLSNTNGLRVVSDTARKRAMLMYYDKHYEEFNGWLSSR